MEGILDRAAHFLPGLQRPDLSSLSPRVGLRPYCKLGRPLLGPVPGSKGLWVAAGHEGSGLTLAPASADLMARQLLGVDAGDLGAAFLPAAVV